MNKPRILESSNIFVFNKRQHSPIAYPAFVYTRVHMHIIYNWQRTLVLVNVALLTVEFVLSDFKTCPCDLNFLSRQIK